MYRFFKLILIALFIFGLQSCIVSRKKYDDILAQKVKTEGELIEKSEQLQKAEDELKELNATLEKMRADTASLNADVRSSTQRLTELNKDYDQLNGFYKNLLN